MRASSIKNRTNTFSTHCNNYTNLPIVQSPEHHDFSKLTNNFNNKNNNYESNYSYFSNRINLQNNNQLENNQRLLHQRFKSLGNSRATIRSGTSSQNNIPHCQSSPYFLHFIPNQNKVVELKPKYTSRNLQQKVIVNVESQNSLNRQPMKLSMKSSHKNYFGGNNQKCSFMKQSQVSTINQTNNTASVISKLTQEKMKKEQLLKYLSSSFQHAFNELRNQIRQQNTLIEVLQQKINKLNSNLIQKQKIISNLLNLSPQKKHNSRQIMSLYNGNPQILNTILTKIKNLQLANQSLKHKFTQHTSIQIKINQNIDKLMLYLQKVDKSKSLSMNLSQQFKIILSKFKKIETYGIESKKILQQTLQIRKISQIIYQKCLVIKKTFNKTHGSSLTVSNAMQQTAQFNNDNIIDPTSSKLKCGTSNESLNQSASYFFHPSQLSNIQKITELFINRHGQPIQCYVDNLNQVRYKDTNTFMFNKKGDIVQLNQCQKRYYIDKGFIIKNK